MKEENLKKVKEAIMDEFGCNEKVAEFSAKVAMDEVEKQMPWFDREFLAKVMI